MYLLVHQQPKLLWPFAICSFGSESNRTINTLWHDNNLSIIIAAKIFYIFNLYLTSTKNCLTLNPSLYSINRMHQPFPKSTGDTSPQELSPHYPHSINQQQKQKQKKIKSFTLILYFKYITRKIKLTQDFDKKRNRKKIE